MRRIWVVGNSGSGKTTLGRELASRIGARHVELDSIYHQHGWTPRPAGEFRARVAEIVGSHSWVVDGNYEQVADLVIEKADTVVWIDFPRPVVMRQLVRRTLSRGLRREELWNGNRESLKNFLRRDPQKSILRWAWTEHHAYRSRYEDAIAGGDWHHLDVVRLQSPAEVRLFVAGV